jgi:protein SCO1/2
VRSRAAVLVATAAALAGCGSAERVNAPARPHAPAPVRLAGHATPDPMRAPGLALRDQDGRLVRLSAERGRVVLLTFLYTGCTDVCPLIASQLSTAVRSLPPRERDRVRVLAVSVDPHGDTPAAVRMFIRRRRLVPQFRYLTGTKAQLAPVWQSWNVLVYARNLERFEHSAFIWLIDRRGITRASYPSSVPARTVAHDLRILD